MPIFWKNEVYTKSQFRRFKFEMIGASKSAVTVTVLETLLPALSVATTVISLVPLSRIMRFEYFPLSRVEQAHGVIVVIDVLRAFTTAAYAFERGAEKILPVSTISAAFTLQAQFPESLIMGEEDGLKPEGFDFGNSPLDISKQDLKNKIIIQRTSAGTQGLTQSKDNQMLMAASFIVAGSTADYLKTVNPETVSFIITGRSMGRDGDEDQACAEYIKQTVHSSE